MRCSYVFQEKTKSCKPLQSRKDCDDDVTSMSFTNAMYWFIRQFEITGKYNTTSIYKAFTFIFTHIARSKYEVQLHGLYYKVDLNSKNGTRNNCTILDVKALIAIKGLRDLDEMLLIESWITTMSVNVTDTDESRHVMRFYPATNSSLCKLLTKAELSRMVEHRYFPLSDPTMWRDTPSVLRFIQTASFYIRSTMLWGRIPVNPTKS